MKQLINKFLLKSKFLRKSRVITAVFPLDKPKGFIHQFHKHLRQIVVYSSGLTRVTPRLKHFSKFLNLILRTYKHHGSTFVVSWLKASHIAIQRYLAGVPVRSLRSLEPTLPLPRLINGLPAFIGTMDRKAIRGGHTPTIRLWLSILSVYRVLDAPRKTKVETITNPFTGSQQVIDDFAKQLYYFTSRPNISPLLRKGVSIKSLKADHLRLSQQGGPNVSPAYSGCLSDAYAVFRYRTVSEAIRRYCQVTSSDLWLLIEKSAEIAKDRVRYHYDNLQLFLPSMVVDWDMVGKPGSERMEPIFGDGFPTDLRVGKLHRIPEPAGKMRVIALVDIWTQSLFLPLHKTLFEILGRIPNDGTFHQELSVHRSKAKAARTGVAYSVDLSSATDRLPIGLQEEILNDLFGFSIGTLWRQILNRPFVMVEKFGKQFSDGESVWYGTGQPMGCLSSWAMLALTHHYIVQFCAEPLTKYEYWFEDYEVLGDDIVIFNTDVYNRYIEFMESLHVGTNPSKSLVSVSSQVFEFAKRTVIKGVDVSGLSWKQFITSTGIKDKISLTLYLAERGLLYRDGLLTRLIGSPHKSRLKDTEVSQGLMISLLSHFAYKGIIGLTDAIAYVCNPSMKGGTLFDCKVPVMTTVHDLVGMLDHLYFHKDNSSLEESDLSLNDLQLRREIGADEITPYVMGSLYRSTIARGFLFEQEFGNIPVMLRRELIASPQKMTGIAIRHNCDVDLIDHVTDLAQSLAFRTAPDEPTHGVFNRVWDMITKIRDNPSDPQLVFSFRDKVEAHVSRFAFLKNTVRGAHLKESPDSWLQADIINSSVVPRNNPLNEVIQFLPSFDPNEKSFIARQTSNWDDPIINQQTFGTEGLKPLTPIQESKLMWDRAGKEISWMEYLNWCFTGKLPSQSPISVTEAQFEDKPLDTDDKITLGIIVGIYLLCISFFIAYLHYCGKEPMYLIIQVAIIFGVTYCLYKMVDLYTKALRDFESRNKG